MTGEPQARSFGRSAGTLSAGVGAAGLLTYVFFALAAHNLNPTAYGEIVVLWSATFVTISVLHRPVEQFISRSVAEHRARSEPIGPTMRMAVRVEATVAVGFAAVALALRGPLEDELFSGSASLYWIYVGAVLAFAASFFARGYLAGEGRFGLLAVLLVSESFSRMAFSLALAVGLTAGRDAVAAGVAAAPLFSLTVVPLAFGRRATRARQAPPSATAAPRASVAKGGGAFAAAVLLIMLSEQIFLNAGPLLIKAGEGAAEAGYIFNVLMLARAPLLVFQGIAISLLPHLTRLRSRGGDAAAEAFEVSVSATLRAIAVFTGLVAAVVALAGPALMQAAFSDRFSYDRAGLLIVTAAMGLYLASTTLNQAALAQGQARRACIAWSVCAVGFLIWSLLPVLDPARRIELGFLVAAGVLFMLLRRIYADPRARSGAGGARGLTSAEQVEAGLALADEAS
jgi:O-antigen/teichoic acid export membrane protein